MGTMTRVRVLTLMAGLSVVRGASASSPSAQPSPADKLAAGALFEQARELAAAGKWKEVCPLLEESQRLDAHMGTGFRLADCYERIGRTASAWVLFLEAASQAREARQSAKERAAIDRAAALEPKLVRLTIVVADEQETQVTRDDVPIGKQQWGLSVPVDPGPHTIVATAPGKQAFRSKVVVTDGEGPITVSVPVLQNTPPIALPPESSVAIVAPSIQPQVWPQVAEPVSSPSPGLLWGGVVTFGCGVATAGTGLALLVTKTGPWLLASGVVLAGAIATSAGGAIWLAQAGARSQYSVSFGPSGIALRGAF
jgi:hypothetical protein